VAKRAPGTLSGFEASSALSLGDTLLAEDVFAEEPLAEDLGSGHFHPIAVNQATSPILAEIKLDRNSLLLFQLPPILPKLQKSDGVPFADPSDEQLVDSSGSVSSDPSAPSTNFPAKSFDSAEHWPAHAEGQVGKLRRYRSGRVTLSIGPVEFEMKRSAFDEAAGELAAVTIDPEGQRLCKLGGIAPGSHFACFLDLSRE
jgi:hypothetical protein